VKIKIDIIKGHIDLIHKKILVFLGIGAGSWIYGISFIESENELKVFLSIPIFAIFLYSGLGLLVNMIKLSKAEIEFNRLEKDLENV